MEVTSCWGSLEPITATVIPGKGQIVVHRFEHLYGTLIVESDREDAAIKIDGEESGKVPRILFLAPGRHKVSLAAPNAPDKTREVEIKVGYETNVRINFAGGSPETTITKPAPSATPKPDTKPRAPAEGMFVWREAGVKRVRQGESDVRRKHYFGCGAEGDLRGVRSNQGGAKRFKRGEYWSVSEGVRC